jgi:hypothetical protein
MSAQEVVLLERRLRQGDAPDVVVFYDGYNDVLAAFVNRLAGVPVWDFHQRLGTLARFWKQSGTYQAMCAAAWNVAPSFYGSDGPEAASFDELADRCAAAYLQNVEWIERLGTTFGFDAQFFWQPVVFNKPIRSAAEERAAGNHVLTIGGYEFRAPADAVAKFFLLVDKLAAEHAAASRSLGVVDLTHAFDAENREVFIDSCHLTELGNRSIAACMERSIAPLVERRLGEIGRASRRSAPAPAPSPH